MAQVANDWLPVKRICVVGMGCVGSVTAACLADLGNEVACVDIDEERIRKLQQGVMPIFEPGLEELVVRNSKAGRLTFTTDYREALKGVSLAFITVGTPSSNEGEADLKYVEAAAESIAQAIEGPFIVVNKSTVPIGTGDLVAEIAERNRRSHHLTAVVSNPEFLREGSAVHDFMHPDRIILGSSDQKAAERVAELYSPLQAPIIITDIRTAEMIKYASNAYLATRISFINEIASICELVGADVKEVARGMGLDKRIGLHYLEAGLGWGGSCLPKDVRALSRAAASRGYEPRLLEAVAEVNEIQRGKVVERLKEALGRLEGMEVGLLGLSFKPNTDDLREAPSLDIIRLLQREGAKVRAYDPVAMEKAKNLVPELECARNPHELSRGCDALILVTEWNEFKQLDLGRIRTLMRRPVFIDGRNIYDPARMQELGFIYRGVGRGSWETRRAERGN